MMLNLTLKMKSRLLSLSKIGVGIAASVGLGWLAARVLDWSLVRDSFANVSVSMLTLGVVVSVASTYLRAYRWQLLFVGETISTYRLFIIQNVGIGLNNVMPIRIASETAQLEILTLRDRIRPSTALTTPGMERVIDVVGSTLIIAVAFFLIPEMNSFTLYVWGAVGFMIVSVGLVRLLAWGSTGMRAIRRIPALAAFADAVRELEQQQRLRLALSRALSALSWLLVGIAAWIIAVTVNLDISLMTATLVIMGTIFFATVVPAAPSETGTFEFAMLQVLEIFGVSRQAGFGFAIIAHTVFFLPPTIMASVFLSREGLTMTDRLRDIIVDRRTQNSAGSA
ncbi:MAG: flippase-like domain-containing protein [Dehalococcoidia bacterium]|nr:flippase-like domain-containing protein [Dehalococcoidia bacterium]